MSPTWTPRTAASTNFAPASPQPSRTSCGRRSRGSSRSSTRQSSPARTSTELIAQARVEVEDAGALIDEILFLSELESGREVVALGHTAALPVLEGRDRRARRRRCARRRRARRRRRRGRRGAAPAAHAADRRREPRGERDPLRRARRALHLHRLACRRLRRGHRAPTTASASRRPRSTRLFERFYRADAARTTRGTGLGLAIVKHIVVAAGGDIDADGGPGRGLRIRATFPA